MRKDQFIKFWIANFSWSSYWESLISATVEDAEPTHVVLTFPKAASLVASDFTIAGFTINSASWAGAVLTLILTEYVEYGDELTITFTKTGGTAVITNNVAPEAELTTYITGLVTPLSTIQKVALNNFIKDIKTGMSIDNLSDGFDWIWLLNNETQEAALKNIVKDDHHGTLEGATLPIHTQFEGVAGDGISGRIDADYIPLTESSAFTVNSASFGYYSNTDVDSAGNEMGARKAASDDRVLIYSRYLNQAGYYLNTDINSGSVISNMNSLGMHIVSRTANNLTTIYREKISKGTSADASSNMPNCAVKVLAVNTAGTVSGFSTRQLGFAFMGKGLSQTDVNAIVDAYNAYKVFF